MSWLARLTGSSAANAPESMEVAGRHLPLIVLRHPRARTVRLRACAATASIRLTVPPRASLAAALAFVETRRDWLDSIVRGWPAPQPFTAGAALPFEGGQLLIDWDETRPLRARREGDRLLIGGPQAGLADRCRRFLASEARARLVPETQALAAHINRSVARVAVNDPRSRWGSCNQRTRSINYSWRLVLAPASVRKSVVAHEVAHLVHADHSPAFWAQVAQLDPDWRTSRRWLASNGAGLHLVGAGF